ncbi:hypothetical protein ACHAQA_003144 [Verticillium albo-atrum]
MPLSTTMYAYCVLTAQVLAEEDISEDGDFLDDLATAQAYIELYNRRHKFKRDDDKVCVDLKAVIAAFGPYFACSSGFSPSSSPTPGPLLQTFLPAGPGASAGVKHERADEDDADDADTERARKRMRAGSAPDDDETRDADSAGAPGHDIHVGSSAASDTTDDFEVEDDPRRHHLRPNQRVVSTAEMIAWHRAYAAGNRLPGAASRLTGDFVVETVEEEGKGEWLSLSEADEVGVSEEDRVLWEEHYAQGPK